MTKCKIDEIDKWGVRQNEIKKENEVGGDNDTDDDNERMMMTTMTMMIYDQWLMKVFLGFFSVRINESVRRCTKNTVKRWWWWWWWWWWPCRVCGVNAKGFHLLLYLISLRPLLFSPLD